LGAAPAVAGTAASAAAKATTATTRRKSTVASVDVGVHDGKRMQALRVAALLVTLVGERALAGVPYDGTYYVVNLHPVARILSRSRFAGHGTVNPDLVARSPSPPTAR
jgi:hypothetical protein